MNRTLQAVALALTLTLTLSACDLLRPPKPSEPETQTAENELMTLSRTALPVVDRGETFGVHVVATAKVDLQLFALSETVPEGFTLVSGKVTAFLSNVLAGETLELTYRLKAGSRKGDFRLSGMARGLPAGGESVQLVLDSPLKVR